jgi:hypothetical protein
VSLLLSDSSFCSNASLVTSFGASTFFGAGGTGEGLDSLPSSFASNDGSNIFFT